VQNDACITQHDAGKTAVRRIALVQQKGGAAKTTLCVHLAVAAEQSGTRTAIIDIDPQASASGVWGQARGDLAPPVAAVLAAELRDALEAAEADGFQLIFIDTPPHTAPALDVVARNIDVAVVPVQPSILDVAATQATLDLLRANNVPAIAVLTRTSPRPDEEILETERALKALGLPLLNTRIVERKVYRRALTQGQAVGEFDPTSKAAKEIRALWKEISAFDINRIAADMASTAPSPKRRA
jgi:chromosome partitioning protein